MFTLRYMQGTIIQDGLAIGMNGIYKIYMKIIKKIDVLWIYFVNPKISKL